MKKYSLLKTIGISFLLVCILSWIISASSLSSGTITSLSKTVPVGLYDLSLLPIITLVWVTIFSNRGILWCFKQNRSI